VAQGGGPEFKKKKSLVSPTLPSWAAAMFCKQSNSIRGKGVYTRQTAHSADTDTC
jgi:hypothetical protein